MRCRPLPLNDGEHQPSGASATSFDVHVCVAQQEFGDEVKEVFGQLQAGRHRPEHKPAFHLDVSRRDERQLSRCRREGSSGERDLGNVSVHGDAWRNASTMASRGKAVRRLRARNP